MTAFDIICSALRLAQVLAADETPTDAEANLGLAVFNGMLDSWNAQRLAVFTTRSDDFPFVNGKQTYTLGTGGDFDMARPARIDCMSAILLANPSNPIEQPLVMFSVDEWQNIPVKNVQGTFPTLCYDTGDFPLRQLNFWPIPQSGNSVRIYSWQALTEPTLLTDDVTFPPGYGEAFRYQLAVRMAPEFGTTVSATVASLAIQSFATVKSMNVPEIEMQSDLVPDSGVNYQAFMFGLPYRGPAQ